MNKKIFFIHVPKTAGTSFNAFLRKNFSGEEHCEMYWHKSSIICPRLSYLQGLDYLSGHVNLSVFKEKDFIREDYFLITFLRNPMHQLLSYINWIIYTDILSPPCFKLHPPYIQKMAVELKNADLYNPDVFIEKVTKFSDLFQNAQSKCFVTSPASSENVIENLLTLDMVGITERYEENLNKFIVLNNLSIEATVEHLHKAINPKLHTDILTNSIIFEFLQSFLSIDIDVYSYFKEDNYV